jgi:hypothetical protein
MNHFSALVMLGMLLAVWGGGHAIAAARPSLPVIPLKTIIHQLGTANGFGFGLDACNVNCELPGPPPGSTDGAPWDVPENPCVPTTTWTHDFRVDLPQGAEVIQALLIVNMAGIESAVYQFSTLIADTTVVPLAPFDRGALGSVPVPVPLNLSDLADGILNVTIRKGQSRPKAVCDEQYYDTSVVVVLVQLP